MLLIVSCSAALTSLSHSVSYITFLNLPFLGKQDILLAFCYRGRGVLLPKTTFDPLKGVSPLKFSKNNIETIAYCFENNSLLSSPLKFFSGRKPVLH